MRLGIWDDSYTVLRAGSFCDGLRMATILHLFAIFHNSVGVKLIFMPFRIVDASPELAAITLQAVCRSVASLRHGAVKFVHDAENVEVVADAVHLLTAVEVRHPVAGLLRDAIIAQKRIEGSGLELVAEFAGVLTKAASDALRDGIQLSTIAQTFRLIAAIYERECSKFLVAISDVVALVHSLVPENCAIVADLVLSCLRAGVLRDRVNIKQYISTDEPCGVQIRRNVDERNDTAFVSISARTLGEANILEATFWRCWFTTWNINQSRKALFIPSIQLDGYERVIPATVALDFVCAKAVRNITNNELNSAILGYVADSLDAVAFTALEATIGSDPAMAYECPLGRIAAFHRAVRLALTAVRIDMLISNTPPSE